MSYSNFIPSYWIAGINRGLKRACVFADGTFNAYEGKVTKAGESVTFTGIGDPTITKITRGQVDNISVTPEKIADASVIMPINQVALFSYSVGDIDKAQAQGNIMEMLKDRTTNRLASTIDSYIAKLAISPDAKLLQKDAIAISKTNVMETLDNALEQLYSQDVDKSTEIEAILPPYFYIALKQQYQQLDTNNSGILTNGKVGKYGNITIKMSNNVYNDGTNDYIQVRTNYAIGYANPFTHTEPFRPQEGFEDAVKGLTLYDAKILRPNELVVVKTKKAS